MITNRERVLEFVAEHPGRDDDEIASALNIRPRQTVNMICRMLCREGLVRRERGGRGKLVNFRTSQSAGAIPSSEIDFPLHTKGPPTATTEDQVKATLVKWLEAAGWAARVAWGRSRGIDILATRGDERWIIECKGTGSSAPMQNNYFLGVVGELLQRMNDDRAKHSIAFPELPKYRRLWSELPANVKQRLELSVLFVTADGSVRELTS